VCRETCSPKAATPLVAKPLWYQHGGFFIYFHGKILAEAVGHPLSNLKNFVKCFESATYESINRVYNRIFARNWATVKMFTISGDHAYNLPYETTFRIGCA
jgi:hypothetical protein